MSTEKTKKSNSNTVHIVGYLKENNLELVKTAKGDEAIRGSIIVATSEIENHKVQFALNKTNKNGEESKDFTKLAELLPEKTISVAGFLKANKTATFETACQAASKIWVIGRFEEFASKIGEREKSAVTIKGFRAGFKSATEDSPFTPCADFTVDVFLNEITEELDADSKKTGRVLIDAILPMYDGSVQKISFVAPAEDNTANYILKNYSKTDTVTLNGDLVSLQEKLIKSSGDEEFFGRSSSVQYETRFIRERRIAGGSKKPIKQGEEGCISLEDVKKGLAARELKMIENGKKKSKKVSTGSVASPSTSEGEGSTGTEGASDTTKTRMDDFDF